MYFVWHNKSIHKYSFFIVVLSMLLFSNVIHSRAQSTFWSKQEKIPEYYDSTEEPPYLIADQNHTVHAFNSQPLELDAASPNAIYYRQWTLENGWSVPIDILYDESGASINLVGVVSDNFGIVHLVFLGSDQNIYYTYAYLAQAGSSTAWSEPQAIAEQATRSGPGFENIGAIAVNVEASELVVIFSGSQYGNGLYYVFSTDHGESWSIPYPIYLIGEDNAVVTDPKLYSGESGIFHAVWSNFRKDGSGGSGYYASWDPVDQLWSNPMELDIPGIRTPSVVEYKENVFVSYHHVSSNGNWWRRSRDYGITWTNPIRISPLHVGTNGGLSFVIDSSETLNAFFGERIDDNNHGMWHIFWTGTSWSYPDAIVRGPQIRDVTGGKGFDPRSVRAVVTNGNVVLVTWGTDGFAGVNGAWYSYKTLDTPELPGQSLILPTAGLGVSQNPIATNVVVGNTPLVDIDNANDYPEFLQSPQISIYLGVVPVLILLIGIIIVRYLVGSKNK